MVCMRFDNLTSNLVHHPNSCSGKIAPACQAINDFAHGSTYSKAELWYLIVLWVTQCHCPFVIVDDPLLQQIFKMLYSKVDVPLPSTVSRDVKEVYKLAKKNVGKVLQVYSSPSNRWSNLINLLISNRNTRARYTWMDTPRCYLIPWHCHILYI